MSTYLHLTLDYLLGLGILAAALLSPLNGTGAGLALLLIGIAQLGLVSITQWKWGMMDLLPVRTHARVDRVLGALAFLLGLILVVATGERTWFWVAGLGAGLALMTLATRWSVEDAHRAPTRKPDIVHRADGLDRGAEAGRPDRQSPDQAELDPRTHDDSESPSEWPDPARPDVARPDR